MTGSVMYDAVRRREPIFWILWGIGVENEEVRLRGPVGVGVEQDMGVLRRAVKEQGGPNICTETKATPDSGQGRNTISHTREESHYMIISHWQGTAIALLSREKL